MDQRRQHLGGVGHDIWAARHRRHLPNGKLWGGVVKVTSRNDTERVELRFIRPLKDDVATAIRRVEQIVGHDKRVRRITQIGVDAVNETNYVLVVRLWVPRHEATQVHFDLNRVIKDEFEQQAAEADKAQAAD